MKVLVTGGAGFIGSHVVDQLIASGHVARVFDLEGRRYSGAVEHFVGTILDLEALEVAMRSMDAVIHLAAVADVKDVFDNPFYSEKVNTTGTMCVLEAARRAKVKRVIYGSTTWVYSDCRETHVDEDVQLGPPSHLYTATKLASEYYCKAYANLYEVEHTLLRFGIPYGPRSRDAAVIPIFVKKALAGESITIQGNGQQFRKFVYVEDLARGIVASLKPVAVNRIYNLDGVQQVSIRQIAETIGKILGHADIVYTDARPGDFSGKEVSSERAAKELGWIPEVSFEEGLRRYIEWYRKRKDAAPQLDQLPK
jgi:UDP-glucose 4-epimerase